MEELLLFLCLLPLPRQSNLEELWDFCSRRKKKNNLQNQSRLYVHRTLGKNTEGVISSPGDYYYHHTNLNTHLLYIAAQFDDNTALSCHDFYRIHTDQERVSSTLILSLSVLWANVSKFRHHSLMYVSALGGLSYGEKGQR